MAILKLFRRGSKGNKSNGESANFLSLPPELRNIIYDLILEDKTLTMISKKGRKPPPPAMLLVSKQVRAEYQPLLLTRATIVADVYNYDFRELLAMSGSLYSRDLKLLRENNNMYIRLQCMRCRKSDLDGLRRWLAKKTNSLDRLPWQYCIGWNEKTATAIKTQLVWGHRKSLWDMHENSKLGESSSWELTHILKAMDAELENITAGLRERVARRASATEQEHRGPTWDVEGLLT